MGQMITLKRPDGTDLDAYAALKEGRASVIVLQEWWGLNDHIKAIVDALDSVGFNGLAPDLYHGRVTKDADEASHMMNGLDFPNAVHQDIQACVNHLSALNPNVGITGFCMGGALSLASAIRLDGLTAAVGYYGIPPKAFADPALLKIPYQGHFATQDDWCTPELVAATEADMRRGGAYPEIFSYEADHAFFNKTRPEVFNAEAAQLSWERMVIFFKTYLT